MKDTKPRPATCNRCGRTVLAATNSGFRVAVDPVPFGFERIRDCLLARVDVYKILYMFGKPGRLELVTAASLKLPSARHATYVGAHGCGCHAMDATAFEGPPDPTRSPVDALDGSLGPSRALSATPPRSDVPGRSERRTAVRCSVCKGLIPPDEDRFMIEWPVWTSVTHHTQNRGPRKGHTTTHEGWGYERWTSHLGGCPTPAGKR